MKRTGLETLKEKICGKTILTVESSKWSGDVKLLTEDDIHVSIKLDDGTVLEVGNVYLHDGEKISDSHTNP